MKQKFQPLQLEDWCEKLAFCLGVNWIRHFSVRLLARYHVCSHQVFIKDPFLKKILTLKTNHLLTLESQLETAMNQVKEKL